MSSSLQSQIEENIAQIHQDIAAMQKHTDLPGPQPRLIAVSKVQPKERIIASLEAGHRVFGENKVQEASERWSALKPDYPEVELHLIGGLQTNKANKAVALFDVIQTLDRIKLAKALATEMEKQNRQLPVFIQVNTGEEDQKGGCLPSDLTELVKAAKDLGLNVIGLMCIPPAGDDPTLHFALLNKLAKRYGLERLSMGMSSDFALAATMGATDIRVGTAIFGERDYS
ncbi:MAG: YggS family pyridoxal phosphate-dependent enzyme [Kordiimonadales bacterium]|nr:MAG: YggS family pyridoxal phosphate-dependent enzyme [Kordiimonadales bacterium]